ncbi:response regulator transcription factor [Planotetraspora phitsanulokensis]|uniref:DNA-binding response regulator n=1 Tax=Planotetraspora phitsanulokensis TaxID=575192 RepID=A0A8J3U0L8_9ACTN|nr:response regulator transcription factor [Planotetraspora phitsanulokensis]GII36085.1 DNA-binding response regulator [Planotetraspora phitsanulokensis]
MTSLPVLLLDDHRVFTDSLALTLDVEHDIHCVATARTAREGLAKAAAIDFAVAITDLQLPDADGFDVIAQLHTLRPEARIIVLTAHSRADLADRAIAVGAVAFLGKDAPLPRILAAIRSADAAHPMVEVERRSPQIHLTDREYDVLRELGRGNDAGRIAATLGISLHTARDHIKAVMRKLGVQTQLDAVVSADRLGLITIGSGY